MNIESISEKFVQITYKSNTAHLNIGACILWPQLLQVIQHWEILHIKKPITGIYSLPLMNSKYKNVIWE